MINYTLKKPLFPVTSQTKRYGTLKLTQGVAIDNQWWQQAQWEKHQGSLASWLLEHLEVFRRIIPAVDEEIDQIDKRILAEHKARAQRRPKYAGEGSLEVIESEVCDWNRFSSWRKAGRCVSPGQRLLKPQPHQPGKEMDILAG
jgi:hypothetical protein